MKVFVLLLTVAVACALPIEERQNGENGWYIPQLDGTFDWMSKEEFQLMSRQYMLSARASPVVEFYLYTPSNPTTPQQIFLNDINGLSASNYNKAYPTRFIIHGWQCNGLSEVNIELRDALLASGSYNVIVVDWSDKAETLIYASAVLHVSAVGEIVANFIDFLYKSGGMSFSNLLVMGHSLGAHVSGFAGKNVVNGRIQQIVGLDTALPLFDYDKPSERLNQNDALYVESIHTNGGLAGFLRPIGRSAFYPNGGKSQPGCGIDLTGACAHNRSYIYYAESIRMNNFPSMMCATYVDAVDKNCGLIYSSVKMGSKTNYISSNGEYYVPVNKKSPFGYGV